MLSAASVQRPQEARRRAPGDHQRRLPVGRAAADLREQAVQRSGHDLADPVVQRGQVDVGQVGILDVVKAQEGEVLGDGDAKLLGRRAMTPMATVSHTANTAVS